MVQNVGLNQAQIGFLRLLSHFSTEEEVRELNDLVCKYYAQKIDEEMDRLWNEGKWRQKDARSICCASVSDARGGSAGR